MDQHANKKHRQSRPSVALHSLKQSRRNIRRQAGRQAGTCNTINNGRTLTQAPLPPPGLPGTLRGSSDSKTQVEVNLNGVKSTSSHNKTAGSSPSTRHGRRPQTTDKKTHFGNPPERGLSRPQFATHTTQHTHTQITSAVSLISAWPRPRHHCHLIRIASTRVDSTSASLARTQELPASPYYITYLPLELPSVTTGRHRLLHPPGDDDCAPGGSITHYPSPVTHLPYYLPFKTLSHTPRSIPASSHHTAAHCTARHRGAHHTQRIAWCHRLPHHRAPGLHDSSPAVNTPAAACRPTQLRPHPAAVSTCCAGPRRKCSTIGQSSPCLLTRSPARDSPRANLTLDRCRPGFQVLPVCSLSHGGAAPPPVEGCTLPSWQDCPRPGRSSCSFCSQHCIAPSFACTHPAPSAPLLPSRTPSLRGTHDNARHHTDGLPCLFLSACICLHLSPSPATLSPTPSGGGMRLSGWLCGLAGLAGWLRCAALSSSSSSCLSRRPGPGFCAGPFLQLVAAGPGSLAIYLSRSRNLGTELPYGSGMAYWQMRQGP